MKYDHQQIEKKWQKIWQAANLYRTPEKSRDKYYVLDMFPYPSGEGLHVGHPKGYIATDILARQKMMQGKAVLHPMGWDAFGLPAENYALEHKVHPSVAVKKNIERFKKQLEILGFTYDWEREIKTTDPEYYKWTQWIFLQLFKKGLAYESREPINWCPSCQTGLANEDLENGRCERCGSLVEKKPLRQWVLKITDYADRLLNDLTELDWPESIKEAQRNWIGKSEGAEINFTVRTTDDTDKLINTDKITVFTTRADTLFGATYLVLAPEHPLIHQWEDKISNLKEVKKYIEAATSKAEIDRTAEGREKTGVELKGIRAVNPANNQEIPIWLADYVLADYGTGAVMAVPAHDERDAEFAAKYKLPYQQVIQPTYGLENKKKEAVHRQTISAVVQNKAGQVLIIKWNEHNWLTPVIGGIEEGETPEQAAEREVLEETGLRAKAIFASPIKIEAHFYAPHKQEWRSRIDQAVLLTIDSLEAAELSEEEKGKYEINWLTPAEAMAKVSYGNNALAVDLAINKISAYVSSTYSKTDKLINSGKFSGLDSEEAKKKIAKKFGQLKTTYKLRDWVFSRQRYWGEPIPIIHCEKCGVVAVEEKDLPVTLPEVKSYEPTGTGESPLANIKTWVNVTCPKCGGKAKRETNTMPQWAGSSWYYLRYIDPQNNSVLVDKKKEKQWSPVDMYVGGAEHATRHLIYARFWHKFLYDIKAVNYPEPFVRYTNLGLILGADGRKMSKRWKNVINPDDMVAKYGADAFRVYEMFLSPFTQSATFLESGVAGAASFLNRIYSLSEKLSSTASEDQKLLSLIHNTIKKVTEDIDNFKFNTAVSSLMILTNALIEQAPVSPKTYKILLQLLAPFAPHLTEELWQSLDEAESIFKSSWPEFNKKLLQSDTIMIVAQINGKMRETFEMPAEASEEEITKAVLGRDNIKKWLIGKEIKKIIFVKGKVVNIVI